MRFARLACRILARHQWSTWQQDDPCTRKRACCCCGTELRQVEHMWSEWTPLTSCQLRRACGRCGKTESEFRHDWAVVKEGYEVVDTRSYDMDCQDYEVSRCSRCGQEEKRVTATYSMGR